MCRLQKSLDSFSKNKKRTDGLCNICKECNKEYQKNHYTNNKSTYKSKAKERKQSIKDWIKEYRSQLKCVKCGEDHPATLDFHHTDSDQKEKNVSMMVQESYSKERILEEISKCIVLCSNCHRIHHWDMARSSKGEDARLSI